MRGLEARREGGRACAPTGPVGHGTQAGPRGPWVQNPDLRNGSVDLRPTADGSAPRRTVRSSPCRRSRPSGARRSGSTPRAPWRRRMRGGTGAAHDEFRQGRLLPRGQPARPCAPSGRVQSARRVAVRPPRGVVLRHAGPCPGRSATAASGRRWRGSVGRTAWEMRRRSRFAGFRERRGTARWGGGRDRRPLSRGPGRKGREVAGRRDRAACPRPSRCGSRARGAAGRSPWPHPGQAASRCSGCC